MDIGRISESLEWAKEFIAKIEASGAVFRKKAFGDKLADVHIAIYEALCCMPYLAEPERRTTFQAVFSRLQGKTYLKLGNQDILPGMTYFAFDMKNDDRRCWALENWKDIEAGSMSEEQFNWAVSEGLIAAMDRVNSQLPIPINQGGPVQAGPEVLLEIERFWTGFETILKTLNDDLLLNRVRSLEVRPGCPNIYELLFRHIQFCMSEGILVVAIRVLSLLLKKSPKAFWDVIGDARPIVIADLMFASPVYHLLLRQSLEDCFSDFKALSNGAPFPTSWIDPWLRSLGRDRRYEACENLLHNLFGRFADDVNIGEPGRAACIRAGFDALTFTMQSFLEAEAKIGTGTTHLYASAAVNIVMKYKSLILGNLEKPQGDHTGWSTFHVSQAGRNVIKTAMTLDMKLFAEEFRVLRTDTGNHLSQTAVTRESKPFWEMVLEMFNFSSNQAAVAEDFLLALDPLIGIEPIRAKKSDPKLTDSMTAFNTSLASTASVLTRILNGISVLDEATVLSELLASRHSFQVVVGLSMADDTDVAQASADLLQTWTGEVSRSGAFEQMTDLQPEQTLGSMLYILERVMKPPFPWDPINPLLHMSRDVLNGLADPFKGVLRTKTLDSRSVSIVLRWWQEQWSFVSQVCRNIEHWSFFIPNATMMKLCREIMELAEALIAEDGLITSVAAKARGKTENEIMVAILKPTKDNFRGMENMIRLKDKWLVDVTVKVLCKILKRLRENFLEVNKESQKLIVDACVAKTPGKYTRPTNLNDQQRAELLQALGYKEDEVEIQQIASKSRDSAATKVQSKLDAWSKSGSTTIPGSKSNRDDVISLSRSIDSPILRQMEAKKAAEAKAKEAKAAAMKEHTKIVEKQKSSAFLEKRQKDLQEKAKQRAEIIARAKKIRGETVPGEGSGLSRLGVTGKDHSRSEIMVNSSDEESEPDDSDSDDGQLAAITGGAKKTMDEAERARRLALRDKERRPVKKVKQQRSVKEMRARLIPPMERLHNTVLAWDIFHQGNDPPSGPSGSKVNTKYPDPKSYQDTFFPLLASEAWRSFVTAKDEITAQPFGMKIASRASVDSFLEITFTMPIAQNRERGVSEGDIILVSEAENPLVDPGAKHCLARVHRINYKKDMVEITYRVASRNNALGAVFGPGTTVHGIKITNMITIEREYAALESLQYYDLMDEILKAEPSPILRYGEEKISNWMRNWTLNRGQAMAVLGAQDNDGFTLIQGPPGTGKTKTIVAMVGALLTEQLNQQPGGIPVGAPLRPIAAPTGNNQGRPKKLLVCAPSNAAVDELVLRLKSGVKTVGGKESKINVLRLGHSDAINAAVRDVTLDELVKNRMESDGTKDKAVADRDKLHQEAAKIKEEIELLRPQLEKARVESDKVRYDALDRRFLQLKQQRMEVGKRIDANKDSGNTIAREVELRRRQVQQQILNSAHVLCATLSGSGHDMFRNLDVEFETVIIDEAAQCVELSALIPLKYGCCKCILVGDPKQLPPTVLSQSAARFGYDQSLFVRMQQNHPKTVHLLDMQYRMHPDISKFPSKEFYEGQLQDGQGMLQLRQQPWHQASLLGPYRFFDVQGVQEKGRKGQSLVNSKELEVALQMYDRFSKDYHECDLRGKIGIITPYKAQLFELRNRFKHRYGESITDIIEFNTTDAFQGRECEIIIFSCVRASPTGGIGFMTDIRRMNVGLTRAKSSLWILGDSRALVQGEFWRKLIEDAEARNLYTKGDILGMFRKPLERAKVTLPVSSGPPTPKTDETGVVSKQIPPQNPSAQPSRSGSSATPEPKIPGQIPPGLGPRADGASTNQTSTGSNTEPKKRPLDGTDAGPPVKRVSRLRCTTQMSP